MHIDNNVMVLVKYRTWRQMDGYYNKARQTARFGIYEFNFPSPEVLQLIVNEMTLRTDTLLHFNFKNLKRKNSL